MLQDVERTDERREIGAVARPVFEYNHGVVMRWGGEGLAGRLGCRVRLVLGDDDLVLVPGEAAEFSTSTPHWTGAVDGPAEALGIFGPQGERVHLRARR